MSHSPRSAPVQGPVRRQRSRRGARHQLRTPWRRLLVTAAIAAVAAGLGAVPAAAGESDVHGFGAPDAGAPGGFAPAPLTGIASAPRTNGYWLVGENGAVYPFGGAPALGSAEGLSGSAIADLAPTPSGQGYWVVASDGGVFAFGDARFHGSLGGLQLRGPVVAASSTRSGEGYWLFTADGGVFAFGDARFYGAANGLLNNAYVIAAAPAPSGQGYRLATTDGGVYAFGDSSFRGSAAGLSSRPITGIASTRTGDGYWLVAEDGSVFAFGDGAFHGTTGGLDAPHPVVDIASAPSGGYWLATGEAPLPPSYEPTGGVWAALRNCESGGNYGAASGNGYYGAYQFGLSTWRTLGTGYAYPHHAPPAVQDAAAQQLQARSGWGQWPHCARVLGLR